MNGAIQRRLFQYRALRMILRYWNMYFRGQSNDPPRRVLGHFLLHRHGHSAQIDAEFLRLDSHGCGHARSESCSDEISRRKRFAFAFVIGRRVSGNLRLGRAVRRVAMQIAAVSDVNFDHVELWVAFGFLSCQVGRLTAIAPGGSGEPPLPLRRKDRSLLNFSCVLLKLIAKNAGKIGVVQDDHICVVLFAIVVLPAFIPPAEANDAGPSI
jgi:hypothetical protein